MTREEARDQIVIFMCDEQKVINDRDKQALDMAIKALEQQPCENTISRQAAIDAVKKNTFRLTFAEEQNCEGHVAWSAEAIYSDVIEGALLELSPVTQQYSKKVNCKSTKCENCINHNYCDYEPQESEVKEE